MEDIYKYAAQNQLRFPTARGMYTVEHLFGMPMVCPNGSGFDLDTVHKTMAKELKELSEESLAADLKKTNPAKTKLEIGLAVVKDVFKTKKERQEAMQSRMQRIEERKKLLDAIGEKKNEALTSASLEDLEKKLNDLDKLED